jgi:lipopolysaccharide transport system permease protein
MTKPVQSNVQLWWQFTCREVAVRHRGSHLGVAWTILTPLLEFAIYATVFGAIFGGRYGAIENETAADYALGVFLSLTLYRFVAEVLGIAPVIIVSQPNYVKKVVFPLHLLPLSAFSAISWRVAVSMLLFLVGLVVWGPGFSWQNLWLPALIVPLLLLSLGLAWGLAALGVFLRDINQLTGALSLVLLYSSAVFYSASMVPEKSPLIWTFLRFNPLLHIVEDARRVMLWQLPPTALSLAYVWTAGGITCLLGYQCFRRLRPAFADVL